MGVCMRARGLQFQL